MLRTLSFTRKDTSHLLLISLLVLLLSNCQYTQKEHTPTAKEVIERYIEAAGGKTKIKAVKSLREEGVVAVPGRSIAETIYLYEPGKTCYIFKSSTGYVIKTIYNNGRAAEVINGETIIITDPLRLERMKLFASLFADIGYLENNYQLSFVNTEKIDGHLNYRIKIISPKGAIDYKLYDAETGLLTMLTSNTGYRTTFSNYETQNGFNLSMSHQTIKKDGSILNGQLSTIIFNKPIDPKVFEF